MDREHVKAPFGIRHASFFRVVDFIGIDYLSLSVASATWKCLIAIVGNARN